VPKGPRSENRKIARSTYLCHLRRPTLNGPVSTTLPAAALPKPIPERALLKDVRGSALRTTAGPNQRERSLRNRNLPTAPGLPQKILVNVDHGRIRSPHVNHARLVTLQSSPDQHSQKVAGSRVMLRAHGLKPSVLLRPHQNARMPITLTLMHPHVSPQTLLRSPSPTTDQALPQPLNLCLVQGNTPALTHSFACSRENCMSGLSGSNGNRGGRGHQPNEAPAQDLATSASASSSSHNLTT